jgi:hypothetical protein
LNPGCYLLARSQKSEEARGEEETSPKYVLDKNFQLAKFSQGPAFVVHEPINLTLAHLEFKDEKGSSKIWVNRASQR